MDCQPRSVLFCIFAFSFAESISDTPDGFDAALEGAEFRTQPSNMSVHRPGVSLKRISPDLIQEDFSRLNPTGMGCQVMQQLKLGGG